MFKKLIKIQNVGKFRACCAAGDVQFRKITLFYAENGRGKTTLCDIFRSLQSGTGELIAGRATLGSGTEPTAEILLERGLENLGLALHIERTSTTTGFAFFAPNLPEPDIAAGSCIEDTSYAIGRVQVEMGGD